jgi:hypothetical protein
MKLLKQAGTVPPWVEVPSNKWPEPIISEEEWSQLSGPTGVIAAPFIYRINHLLALPEVSEDDMFDRELELESLQHHLRSMVDSYKRQIRSADPMYNSFKSTSQK